jgi:hypothetical protein
MILLLIVMAIIMDVIGVVVVMVVIKMDVDVGIIENNLKRGSSFDFRFSLFQS